MAKRITRPAILALLTFLGGLIRLPLGPIPLTFQTLFVLLAGLLLDPRGALLAMTLNFILSLILSGTALFLSPSLGFLLAFIPAASLLAFLSRRKNGSLKKDLAHIGLASALIYLLGLTWMALQIRWMTGRAVAIKDLLLGGLVIFLPGDLLKAGLALFVKKKLMIKEAGGGGLPSPRK